MSGLRDALQSIYDQRGSLTPALVVDEARPEDHPLHSRFEWDDTVAGEKYRRVQAQELIRSVKVVYREAKDKKPEGAIRAWQSVRRETGHVYEPSEEVAQDPVTSQIVLMDMRREWKALQQRYGHFKEFVDMVQADLQDGAA